MGARRLASLRLKQNGVGRPFVYPPGGNITDHLAAIFQGREYPPLRLVGYSPEVIVDIGANIGAASVFFAMAYPKSRVVAYEPSAANFDLLLRNVAGLENVECHPIGLADRNGHGCLHGGSSHTMQNSLFKSAETGDTIESVNLERAGQVLSFLRQAESAVVKIDTEGAEMAILNDLAPLPDGLDLIYVEYHAEDDRRAIDRMVEDRFILLAANAQWAHRGLNTYVARRLVDRYPTLDLLRIGPAT